METPEVRAAQDLTVCVRVISPSQELAGFPDLDNLPPSTTIGQVKLLIGNELAARRCSPTGMRVIYRGRVLDVDDKTLSEVFGISTVLFFYLFSPSLRIPESPTHPYCFL